MSSEQDAWKVAWKMITHVNELTEEIIKLKENERENNAKYKLINEDFENLKVKYYVALSDLQKKKTQNKKKWFRKWF